jgi:ABC-type glycerol-3-phosphate transport system substrate-binding protein
MTQLDSPASVAGHEFLQDLAWKYHVSQQLGKDPSTPGFTNGRRAMIVGGGWNFWNYASIKDFKWGVAALPIFKNNKNVAYNDNWEMARDSKNKEAAWAFLAHVTSPDVQAQYSQLTGTPPTTKAAMDAWYKRYEQIMPRADLEKLTQGAIDPKRSQESPDHLFVDWYRMDDYYSREIKTPILENRGKPGDVIARAKPGYDAIAKQTFDQLNGKS